MNRIQFEWKFIIRNKRLRSMLISMSFFVLYLYVMLMSSNFIITYYFTWRMLFLVGLFSIGGSYYGVLSLSGIGSFIERLLVSPVPVFEFFLSKYYLYSIFSFVMALLALPALAFGIEIMEIIASYIFSVGFVYFLFFQGALLGYKRINVEDASFQNWQGFTFSNQFLIPFTVFLIVVAFVAMSDYLVGEQATLIIMSVIGVCFIATHTVWLKSISGNIEKTKYYRLERFRENG